MHGWPVVLSFVLTAASAAGPNLYLNETGLMLLGASID
jgi:hypothetical protein